MILTVFAALTSTGDGGARVLWVGHPHRENLYVRANPPRASKKPKPFRTVATGQQVIEPAELVAQPLSSLADVARFVEWCDRHAMHPETRTADELRAQGAAFFLMDLTNVPASERANL